MTSKGMHVFVLLLALELFPRAVFAQIDYLSAHTLASLEVPPPSAEVLAHVATIISESPHRRADAFMKMGGSSVASTAYLHCFATEHVKLDSYSSLQSTINYFNESAGEQNPFRRQSAVAGVGWNLRYVLRSSKPLDREIEALNPRYALVMFGGNDVQNRNERVFARRLHQLIEQLIDRGVVPVLGTISPSRYESRNIWIERFNEIIEAVASAWQLPLIDYYAAMVALPNLGLARDGIHPNVLGKGGLSNSCRFDSRGLLYGQNARNFMSLQMLSHLRWVEPDKSLHNEGTPLLAVAEHSAELPADDYSALLQLDGAAKAAHVAPSCRSTDSFAPQHSVVIDLTVASDLRVSALGLNGRKPRVGIMELNTTDPEPCWHSRTQSIESHLPPGRYRVGVDADRRALVAGDRVQFLLRTDADRGSVLASHP